MAEEEFHEIQLNGKQLVFLFITGTVAAVVIFLCGLMVGRNLRVPRLQAAASTVESTIGDPTRPSGQVPPPPSSDGPETGPPVTTKETLTYSSRLEAPAPAEETLGEDPTAKPTKPVAKVTPAPVPQPVPAPKSAAPKDAAKDVAKAATTTATATAVKKDSAIDATSEPAGNGWVVQVVAPKTRQEADAVAQRLKAKGYPSFVTPRGTGSLLRYGVRVGKYDNKRDAEAVKTKLEKDEQFKPWVTR